MHPVEKLLIATGIGRSVYSRWQFQKIMSALVTVTILTVTTAVMMCVLIIGGIYAAYLLLIGQGAGPVSALLMVAVATLLIITALIAMIRDRVRGMKSTVNTPVGDAVDAFLDGLLAK